MNAHMFLKERDKEFGDNWNYDREQLAAALREYAHLKISEWRESNEKLRVLNAQLLEPLEDLVKRDYFSGVPEHFQRTEKARAAIAKAKGESESPVTSEGKSE